MKKFDKKAQMMDAGTALFESKDGYGSVLGQVKAELKEFGQVSMPDESAAGTLPGSTGACDLFLDYSTPWRKRYLSCQVEDAGDTGRTSPIGEPIRRYAVTFKEGNRSTFLRNLCFTLAALAWIGGGLLSGRFYLTLLAIIPAVATLYIWMIPSRTAQATVRNLIAKINAFGGEVLGK